MIPVRLESKSPTTAADDRYDNQHTRVLDHVLATLLTQTSRDARQTVRRCVLDGLDLGFGVKNDIWHVPRRMERPASSLWRPPASAHGALTGRPVASGIAMNSRSACPGSAKTAAVSRQAATEISGGARVATCCRPGRRRAGC
jgi:hypothetical protein